MPYLPGEELAIRYARHGPLPVGDGIPLLVQVCRGLGHAHALQILHRDLKPENVMLVPDRGAEGGTRAVVMDFGLAKILQEDPALQRLTRSGFVLGTPEFMSPEQLMGKPLDPRSDLYATGLLAFEMFAGRLPFEGKNAQEVALARLKGPPLRLRSVQPSLPEALDAVIARALAPKPADRFQTMEQLGAAFASVMETTGSRTTGWNGFTFQHRNREEFELIAREIFEGGEYAFDPETSAPTILDCGSHIGLSVAWFKRQFPGARIIAFEPDPRSFELLQANVAGNGLDRVELLNVAVSSRRGTARFFGEFGVATPMASAHSLREVWGTQRSEQWIQVDTVPLADYITGPIDYLKLDIEGMELEVMRSITHRLDLIRAAGIEFHGTGPEAAADEAALVELLRESGFQVSIARKTGSLFPPEIGAWVERVRPCVSMIKAARARPLTARHPR
jgi:FkbM family methyltransferase